MMAGTFRYKPANTVADLSDQARGLGRQSMAEFLVSPQVQRPVSAAAKDISEAARDLALAEATRTGSFANAFESGVGGIMVVAGNPRVTAQVSNSDPAAMANEYGGRGALGSNVPERRILGRAAQPWHTAKGEIG